MNNKNLKFILFFLVCVLLQVLVFNNINFFQSYNPYIYLLCIIIYNGKVNKYLFLLVSFLLGFLIDLSMYTGGIHAFATVLLAFSRDFIVKLTFGNDYYNEEFSLMNYNFFQKLTYTTICIFLHHLVLFGIENFNFYSIDDILLNTVYTSLLTLLLLQVYFGLFVSNNDE